VTTKQALAVAGRQTWASHDDFETRKAALEQLAAETQRLAAILRELQARLKITMVTKSDYGHGWDDHRTQTLAWLDAREGKR
jgi:hypothetical protein